MTKSVSEVFDDIADDYHRPVEITSVSEYEQLRDSVPLVLLEFVTPGCGICASMEPVLGTVARSAPGVVAIVNGATVPDLTAEFDVRAAPTLIVLEDGAEVARLDDGFQSAQTLIDRLEKHATE